MATARKTAAKTSAKTAAKAAGKTPARKTAAPRTRGLVTPAAPPPSAPRGLVTPAAPPPSAPRSMAKQPTAAPPPSAPAAKKAKPEKKERPALVRDGFTMPEPDFALIARLKARALQGQRAAKKSELLRAGLHALAALDTAALVAALDRLAPVQTGRPKKGR